MGISKEQYNVNRLQNAKVAYLNFSNNTQEIGGVAEILEVKDKAIKVQWVEEVTTHDMGSKGYSPEIYTQPNEYKLSDLDYCKIQHMSDAKIQQRREDALINDKPFFDIYEKNQEKSEDAQDFTDAVSSIPVAGEQIEQ